MTPNEQPKHTPGPLEVVESRDKLSFHVRSINDLNDGFATATCQGPNKEGNAYLYAAAPDLLEACQEFVRKVEAGQARSNKSYQQMKTAISKALNKPL